MEAAEEKSSPVELLLPEGGPPLNRHFSLQVLVPGPAPEKVVVDADMPAHRHGMLTQPVLTPQEEGRYRVDGMLLHMPGAWVITVDVTRNGVVERSEFPLNLDFAGVQ
ncbi:MAG: hypothetical protein DWQ01_07010 [Planctomycetota bacterium]|nr:MAG: hypothetical protein DWQ01_07010 [Planctomycetota bacterium]